MKIKLALFDLGSTLVYFKGNWDRVVNEAIDIMSKEIIRMGYPVNQDLLNAEYAASLQQYYIDRDIDNIERSTTILLDKLLQKRHEIHLSIDEIYQALDAFYSHTGSHWLLDPESIPVLENLQDHNYQLGLISNASYNRDVYQQLQNHNLDKYFSQILISAEVGYRKPHAHIFQQALDFFDVDPASAVMIGDTLNADIIGSRRMGMKNIWIARWASAPSTHYRDDMIVPDRTVQRLSQLPAIIENWQ